LAWKDRIVPVQDDARERQMIQLFNLTVPEDRGRSDIDAHLTIDGRTLDFELKSTTGGSVSTVRDFGPDHIRKWRNGLHWLFAFYDKSGSKLRYCVYASPDDMEPWIAEKERYMLPDIALADALPGLVTEEMAARIMGDKPVYPVSDAKWIMKKQWRREDYLRHQDVEGGYSRRAIVDILNSRARYVILRGATLNNPHIESGFFDGFERITDEHAARLRELVRAYLRKASATEQATA
jgi:hypothetical protein